ncbi:unnamed protein product [Periconia digitata]|uniref:Uncharacterized protein n=1 Tax=Periconia digitata TaxID=1303443 RepID=A0A9W4URB4_9PLEO|nr:unnamed protein product [Periconia digitata]
MLLFVLFAVIWKNWDKFDLDAFAWKYHISFAFSFILLQPATPFFCLSLRRALAGAVAFCSSPVDHWWFVAFVSLRLKCSESACTTVSLFFVLRLYAKKKQVLW